jgi:formylglycine-generating enzyme required for sulfatase activity
MMANSMGMEFVLIPAGEFTMGVPDVGNAHEPPPGCPAHRVRLTRPFWLGKHEVTRRQFRDVMGSLPAAEQSRTLVAPDPHDQNKTGTRSVSLHLACPQNYPTGPVPVGPGLASKATRQRSPFPHRPRAGGARFENYRGTSGQTGEPPAQGRLGMSVSPVCLRVGKPSSTGAGPVGKANWPTSTSLSAGSAMDNEPPLA